jgi:hypothetical protein
MVVVVNRWGPVWVPYGYRYGLRVADPLGVGGGGGGEGGQSSRGSYQYGLPGNLYGPEGAYTCTGELYLY